MSEVRITVGPKTYTIRCGAGEEAKVARLGALIDEHYARLGSARTTSEAHNLVFAALFVADALEDARSERALSSGAAEGEQALSLLAGQLEILADRAEQIADALEGEGQAD